MDNSSPSLAEIERRRGANLILLAAGLSSTGRPQLEHAATRLLDRIRPPDATLWPYLLARAHVTRMTPMLDRLCNCLDWEHSDLRNLAIAHAIAQKHLFARAEQALDALIASGITPAVIKGSDFVWSLYPDGLPRQMVDVDLLIKPHELMQATEALTDLGYFQGAFNRDTLAVTPLSAEDMADFIKKHYELPPFLVIDRCGELREYAHLIREHCLPRDYMLPCGVDVFILIEIDVHFNLSFDLALDDIWSSPRELDAFGRRLPALSWETQIWFLCGRIYIETLVHGAAPSRGLVDLAAILERGSDTISWESVIVVAERYQMFPALYYVLDLIRQLSEGLVPERVIELCRTEVLSRRGHPSNRGALDAALFDGIAAQRL